MSYYKWLRRRESGTFPKIGDGDFIMKKMYTSMQPYTSWNDLQPRDYHHSEYGAVFNLEFSPEGNILAAACERKAIILFDAVSQKQTQRILEAHMDNVNCIKFLDNRTFATCSDDTTVALWDIRFLKRRLRSLQGHSNWVKNIEYSYKDGLLVTSGFDGSIFTWDINSHTEEGLIYQKVFNTSGLMRCRISPDCSKLVMCTTGGYLMIIHDLDLTTLHKDLCGFRPSIYRLMQMGNQLIPQAAKFDHIFSKKQLKNRVELVADFPDGNDAEVILALQMHPHGLSFLSRNISYDDATEWSCIHDINEEPYDITLRRPHKRKRKFINDEGEPSTSKGKGTRKFRQKADPFNQPSTSAGIRPASQRTASVGTNTGTTPPFNHDTSRGAARTSYVPGTASNGGNVNYNASTNAEAGTSSTSSAASSSPGAPVTHTQPIEYPVNFNDPRGSITAGRPEFVPDIWAAEITIQERAARQARGRQTNSVTGYDFVYAISSGILPMQEPVPRPANAGTSVEFICKEPEESNILQNAKKLMYYIEESNKGKGFIKEPSFSSDGRIICSPYNTGVRLLSYSQDCSEHPRRGQAQKLKKKPKKLMVVKNINCHSDIVLSTAFSPTLPLLVTGCKLGKVTWHFPNL